MTPRLKRLFVAVIVIQVVFLLGLVGYRESILIGGRTAVLETVPVDPRDLFKGEYVTLRYEISTLGQTGNTPGAKSYRLYGNFNEGDTAYVTLTTVGSSNPYSTAVQAGEPHEDADLFIKGRVTSSKGGTITVDYGIEQYFIPEGRGLEIEQADDVKVRVKINRSGTAAIEALIVDGEVWRP
jgi:uncharacterized membrane-anchored protein